MAEAVLLVGTKKGLWIGRSDESRRSWTWSDPEFLMQGIYATGVDTRGDAPRIFVGGTSEHFGPGVYRSDDLGQTWTETRGASVKFPSDDRGESFELVRSLWDHPHRPEWGAGYGGQAIHTIVPHPDDGQRLTVAMSTGGVFQTAGGGGGRDPTNQGISASFFPDPWPEFGQCVHKVAAHPARPDRMFAQNHGGVYRTDDAGGTWTSIADGLPADFGFPIVVHPHDPDTVFVFPLAADSERIPPGGRARVWRSTDAGETWTPSASGLPDRFYAAVMRDAFATDNAGRTGLYFGARDGTVFASLDDGESWTEIAEHLPDVLSVRAVVV